jgi:hypothetical protein
MRKVFVLLMSVLLLMASITSPALANSFDASSRASKNSVPAISVTEGGSSTGSAPATGSFGALACVNSQTGIGRNPLGYVGWSDVAMISACGHITVKVYDILSTNSVVVRIMNGSTELTPRVVWDSTQNGWTYTWTVAQGTYTVQASAYTCCSSTAATFDVWTD